MKSVVIFCLVFGVISGANAQASDNCRACICQIEGCSGQIGQCNGDGGASCGPFQITKDYFTDCYQPGMISSDYFTCVSQMACSVQCFNNYMARYAAACSSPPTCETYARVHNGGPNGCNDPNTQGYWNNVNNCCSGKAGGC